MLTAWGKKVVACATVNGYKIPYVTASNTQAALIPATSALGASLYIPHSYYNGGYWALITSALAKTSYGVAFGSDSTAPTENDYTLGSQITGISAPAPTIETVIDTTNWRYIARLDYAVSNNTGTTITIAELGLFEVFYVATTRGATPSASSSNRHSFMIDRTVLDTPITIPNGSAAVVRYEFAYEG